MIYWSWHHFQNLNMCDHASIYIYFQPCNCSICLIVPLERDDRIGNDMERNNFDMLCSFSRQSIRLLRSPRNGRNRKVGGSNPSWSDSFDFLISKLLFAFAFAFVLLSRHKMPHAYRVRYLRCFFILHSDQRVHTFTVHLYYIILTAAPVTPTVCMFHKITTSPPLQIVFE